MDVVDDRWTNYVTVLRPERDEPDWWAGAPSVAMGPGGRTYMASRMRGWTSDGPGPISVRAGGWNEEMLMMVWVSRVGMTEIRVLERPASI